MHMLHSTLTEDESRHYADCCGVDVQLTISKEVKAAVKPVLPN